MWRLAGIRRVDSPVRKSVTLSRGIGVLHIHAELFPLPDHVRTLFAVRLAVGIAAVDGLFVCLLECRSLSIPIALLAVGCFPTTRLVGRVYSLRSRRQPGSIGLGADHQRRRCRTRNVCFG